MFLKKKSSQSTFSRFNNRNISESINPTIASEILSRLLTDKIKYFVTRTYSVCSHFLPSKTQGKSDKKRHFLH